MAAETWAEIKDVYSIDKPSKQSRLETLDDINNRPETDIIEDSKSMASDIMRDANKALKHSNTLFEWLSAMWIIITSGNRGILVGTMLIIVSLLLLATTSPSPSSSVSPSSSASPISSSNAN